MDVLIGDLYDGVIWLQLPESFTFSLSNANWGYCYLKPTGHSKFKWQRQNERNSGSCSQMTTMCKSAIPEIWSNAAALEDPLLRSLVPDLLDLQLGSRTPSTLTKCECRLVEMARIGVFEDWCSCLSGKALAHCIFYYRTYERLPWEQYECLPLEAVVYGIKWAHSMAGLEICPANHPLVKSSLEDAKRKLARPVPRKSLYP